MDVKDNIQPSFDQKSSIREKLLKRKLALSECLNTTDQEHSDSVSKVSTKVQKQFIKTDIDDSKQHQNQLQQQQQVQLFKNNQQQQQQDSQLPKEEAKSHEISINTTQSNDQKEDVNIESLLSLPTIREKESIKVGEEILQLLSKPTAKERSLIERFRSADGGQVQEFCLHGTKEECVKMSSSTEKKPCEKLHFKKIIQKHTEESLGDCSFLNTCFHMESCKYVHYQVDFSTIKPKRSVDGQVKQIKSELPVVTPLKPGANLVLHPPQWIQSDLRYFDVSILGKFAVVMADPPWDIHMELPYGTMSDDEMRQLNIPCLQDEGLIFLWVTGRAMELGRECLSLWGYERCDEIIWVKTNQLQRIIRTGRTGHWLNHGKEHCLVGIKGNPSNINRGLDCDVIVAEVRATSHKPDEIYGIIERLSPGTRKLELFGRPHNVQPNWITLGNQLDGVHLIDPVLIGNFKKRYPDGNCMQKT